MYDILQLNDMLVPELLDIAEDLKIENAKKLDKQGLIYKILDKQAVSAGGQKTNAQEKGKRKRIVKASTANSTEEAVVEDLAPVQENKRPIKKVNTKKEEKPKKGKRKDEEQPESEEMMETAEPAQVEEQGNSEEPETSGNDNQQQGDRTI